MGEFFANVTRYPRYLIAFGLGVASSVFEPLLARYGSPEDGLAGAARGSQKLSLMLERLHPTGMASAGVEASDPSGLRPKVR